MLSLACQLDNSCPVAAWELLHTTKWTLLFWCTLTTQCIKFVLLQLRDCLGGSSPWLGPLLPWARQFIGQSEAFRVPMLGTWQVTRWKNVNFCHNWVWRNICSAPSPLSVYWSSCHCICIKKCKTWIWSAYKYDKYAKICTPLCWWCFAAASGCGSDLDGCYYLWEAPILQWHPLWLRLSSGRLGYVI